MSSNTQRSISYSPMFPAETWGQCWQYCSLSDLRRLALVCRLFCLVCRPFLFRRQALSAPHAANRKNWVTMTKKMHNRVVALQELPTSPFVEFVREWHFVGAHGINVSERWPEITNIHILHDKWLKASAIFTATLGVYHRVTVLHLTDLTMDAEVRTTLESLTNLEELSLATCTIVARMGNPLPVKLFTFTGFGFPTTHVGPLHIVDSQELNRLTLGGHPDAEPLLQDLQTGPLPCLVYLSVTVTAHISNILIPFLACCTQLESIQILQDDSLCLWSLDCLAAWIPDPLPPNILPALKSFKGPPVIAGRFVRDRPVERVWLAQCLSQLNIKGEELLATLRAISQGLVPLNTLTIVPAFPAERCLEIFSSIGALFPELHNLSLKIIQEEPRPPVDTGSDVDDEEEQGVGGGRVCMGG
ncbi:hypothetical protein MSAN_02065300 [Mycena sanguinolenta]|uniref:F-box domain-containing protein n=1 Tax=Mycena sanguinolenta TaxID=230812 RepID=A0A8H6XJJ3_9AGAR|nr:hypothetical protein MSAN_02065300 [Mycena sanguinolenta]